MMSKKLFYEDAYLNEWTTEIQCIQEKGEDYIITLDKTYFYPEGGGQPSDSGTINGIKVIDVFEKDETIYHVLKEKPEGITAHCIIDFEKRFDHMQQHSGEHLLSGVFYNLFGAQNKGFHMGEDYVTIDITLGDISEEMLKKAEEDACEIIYKNVDVNIYFTTDKELPNIALRKECKVKGEIRIVEIGDADRVACCGTHVRKSGEIGIIKIIKTEKYKGMTRIYFKCGKRAQKDYEIKHNIISSLIRLYSTPEDKILTKAKEESSCIKEYEKEIKSLKQTILGYEAERMVKSCQEGLIVRKFDDKSTSDIQILSKLILEKENFTIIFCSIPEKRLIIADNKEKGIDCGKVLKEILPLYNGKGGGNNRQAQAGFETSQDMEKCYLYLRELAEKTKG